MTYIYHIIPNLNFLIWGHLTMAVSCSLFVLYKPVGIFCWFRWCRRFRLVRCLWGLVPRETLCFQTFGDGVQLNVWGSFINSSYRKIQMWDFLRWTLKSRRRIQEWYMYISVYIIITVTWSEVPDHVKLTGTDHQIKWDAQRWVWSSDLGLSSRSDLVFQIKLLI